MALQKTEVSKFRKGIVSSASEEDLNSDVATFSLNIDAEKEVFALRGIKGNYILGASGWEVPRYAKWEIVINTSSVITLNEEIFVVNAYDKQYALIFTSDGSLSYKGTDLDIITEKGWIPVTVDISSALSKGAIADAIKTALDTCTCSEELRILTGNSTYFTTIRGSTAGLETDTANGSVIIKSNFFGDIPIPYTPTILTGTIDTGDMYFPDFQIYDTNSTKHIKGTGLSSENNTTTGSYNFSF